MNLATRNVESGTWIVRPNVVSGRLATTGSARGDEEEEEDGVVSELKSLSISALFSGVSGE